MKKMATLFLTLALVLSLSIACAEETTEPAEAVSEATTATEINWDELAAEGADLVDQGEFVTYDGPAFKMWVPTSFTVTELTDEEISEGYLAYYTSDDDAYAISVMNIAANGQNLDEYKSVVEENGADEIEFVTINGTEALSYVLPETDTACIAFVTDNDTIFEVCGAPQSDEGFQSVLTYVMASVQPA